MTRKFTTGRVSRLDLSRSVLTLVLNEFWPFSGGSSLMHKTRCLGIPDERLKGVLKLSLLLQFAHGNQLITDALDFRDHDQINLCHALAR